ncbi:MAG: hypothetical protein V3V01_04555 [Acidimicrobiales bacterium]
MSTTMPKPMGIDSSHDPLSMFYLRAENEDGHSLDLAVVAETQTAAIDLWCHHYFEPNEPVAEQSANNGKGLMTLATSSDLDQGQLEPGPIDWTIEPFPYPGN